MVCASKQNSKLKKYYGTNLNYPLVTRISVQWSLIPKDGKYAVRGSIKLQACRERVSVISGLNHKASSECEKVQSNDVLSTFGAKLIDYYIRDVYGTLNGNFFMPTRLCRNINSVLIFTFSQNNKGNR